MSFLDVLVIFFAAMTPVGELRLAIPLAIYTMDIPRYIALPTAVMGNMIPILIFVNAMDHISKLAVKFPTSIGRLIN